MNLVVEGERRHDESDVDKRHAMSRLGSHRRARASNDADRRIRLGRHDVTEGEVVSEQRRKDVSATESSRRRCEQRQRRLRENRLGVG